jgi:hypothetical protein
MTQQGIGDDVARIRVDIGDQRLPARMVAQRIRADLRQSRGIQPLRFRSRSRLTVFIVAALLIPALGMMRFRSPETARTSGRS